MAESESITEVVNQTAIQAATAMMMAFRYADTGPQPTPLPKPERATEAKAW